MRLPRCKPWRTKDSYSLGTNSSLKSDLLTLTSDLPLRQGDICEVSKFPLWTIHSSEIESGAFADGILIPAWPRVAKRSGKSLVAICSHDCDVENPRGRTGVLVAPLIPVPASPGDADRFEKIVRSGVMVDSSYAHINLFPLGLDDILGGTHVIDMSALITLAPSEKALQQLESQKVAEMSDEMRTHFKQKLASFVGRP